jgi:HPt (histidine-containing phosphotransfer) domain-containing protein
VSLPPPNESLQSLESVLGSEATREIVRLFLHDFPESARTLGAASRDDQARIAHGLKTSALHMGATGLSERMAAIEEKLAASGEALTAAEIAAAVADFGSVEPGLRRYAGT